MDVTSIMSHINVLRARHGAAPLQWSNRLAQQAQDRVNREITLAGSTAVSNNTFGHNVATSITGNLSNPTAACLQAINTWQGEQVHHDFDKPGYNKATRNFAALVWRSMTHVGFGVGRDGQGYTVSAVFEPGERYLDGVGDTFTHSSSDMKQFVAHDYKGRPTPYLMMDIIRAPSSGLGKNGIHTEEHRSSGAAIHTATYSDGVSGFNCHNRTWRPGLVEFAGAHASNGGLGTEDLLFGSDQVRAAAFAQDVSEFNGFGIAQRRCATPLLDMLGASSCAHLREKEMGIPGSRVGHGGVHVATLARDGGSSKEQVEDCPGSSPREDVAVAPSSVCVREDSVEVGELRSKNERFRFVMQPDHILTLYMDKDAVWAIYLQAMGQPHPFPADGAIRLVLQTDGNLVALDPSLRSVWATDTANRAPGPYTLTMQDDGNCVLLAGGGVRLWATNTHGWGRDIHRRNP